MRHASAPWWRRVLSLALLCTPAWATAADYSCDRSDPRSHVLQMRGGIGEDEFARFKNAYAQCFPSSYGGQTVVDLHSGGGLVSEALDIANALIALGQRGIPVLTRISRGSYCISACTYLFVAGRMRDVQAGGSLEPHGFSSYRGRRLASIARAALVDGNLQADRVEMASRLPGFLARTIAPLAAADERFAWLGVWSKEFGRSDGRYRPSAAVALMQDYLAMSAPRRLALDRLESIVTVVMTELQRVAALKAFEPLLRSGRAAGGLPGLIGEADEARLQNWLLREFLVTLNLYLSDSKLPGAALKNLDVMASAVRELQQSDIRSTAATVTEQLWPFLSKRDEVLDMDGFVRLMFSTSIIYMRPLTREELCDFNLVSTACE
jgi:hypothetical protein